MPASATEPAPPTLAWIYRSLPRALAFGLGSGLLRPAPGTWGTALAWLLWVAGLSHLPDLGVAGLLVVAFGYGCWACQRVGQELGISDHGGMVWDEIVAFWLVLWLVPATLGMQALAFVLFRAFDIIKPAPIGYFDRHLRNGLGVMWDDLLAGVYTLLVIAVLVRLGLVL